MCIIWLRYNTCVIWYFLCREQRAMTINQKLKRGLCSPLRATCNTRLRYLVPDHGFYAVDITMYINQPANQFLFFYFLCRNQLKFHYESYMNLYSLTCAISREETAKVCVVLVKMNTTRICRHCTSCWPILPSVHYKLFHMLTSHQRRPWRQSRTAHIDWYSSKRKYSRCNLVWPLRSRTKN
jgi:hypothetical protein